MASKQNYNELKRNTLIIGISNLGSKSISFILAPLYSYYLSTSQYGTMDLITTTAGLIMPLLCLDIYEAAFRFASDKKYDDKTVFSSSFSLSFLMSLLAIIVVGALNIFINIPAVVSFSILSAVVDANYQVLSQFARGQNRMKVFALSGVINSVVLFASDILFLVLLRYGLNGWMIAYIIGKVIACLYVMWAVKIKSCFSFRSISKTFYKEAVKYALPLLPTTSMWWVMNASDRYIITLFMGTAANGIYAVANKMPSLLSVFENIFYQAWQTSSINALEDKNRDKFYSGVFQNYFSILALGVLGLLLILKPLTIHLFAREYESAWMCTAILVIGVMFHALGGNLGTLYGTFKSTKGALITAIIGAVTNTVLNFIFIPHFGIMAAAATTLVGYIAVLLYRWWDVKKFVRLTISPAFVVLWLALIAVQFALYYWEGLISYGIRAVIVVLGFYLNRDLILRILKR
jgi:O-antigen/teichoic acid export membrane protein